MPITVVARRERTIENLLIVPLAAIVAAAIAVWVFVVDRAPPFEYVSTDLSPRPVEEGGILRVSRTVVWHRDCDGEIFREVVKPGGQIVHYDRGYRPYPFHLGRVTATSTFDLPPVMLSPDQPRGTAIYRGRVRFTNCGFTSRIWPLEVPFQEAAFEVVRRQ